MRKKKIKWGFIALVIFMIICVLNLGLSAYIMQQKSHNDSVAKEKCFAGDGGCYTVQTSAYAKTFGIPNPYYGYFFFGVGILVFGGLLVNRTKRFITNTYLPHMLDLIQFFLLIGAAFSIWLLYVQYFILFATCKYCLLVDGFMIVMAILFAVVKLRILHDK